MVAVLMKPRSSSGARCTISLITHTPGDAALIRKTLSHVYPGVVVTAAPPDQQPAHAAPTLFVVDTAALCGSPLEHFLETTAETPAVLLVDDFSEVRHYSPLLSGRRSIVTRADIEGMGLIGCIHHLLERQVLTEQLQKTSRHLKELAIRDDLTRLYNHRHMDELLTAEVKKANRYRRPLGLVIVAIKNFMAINENLGHHEGDRLLARAADCIRQMIREVDIPARYGDNEFAIILPESDEAAAAVVAQRIQDALGALSCERPEGTTALITSCGIASLSPVLQTKDELLRTALGALLEAKRNGHNALCTSADMAARRRDIRENRQFIEQLHGRISRIAADAQRGYFQSVMKVIGEIPLVKRSLMPHSERVAFFAQRLAESISLAETEVHSIYRAGLLHDAGKLAIDAEILSRPGHLTCAEHELVRQHPLFAIQMLGSTSFFTAELPAVLHHHERMDGDGYPERLSGDAIPLAARILAIAEAWDTMITSQPYRTEPLPLDQALAELSRGAGSQFDPELASRFAALISG